MAWMRHRPSLVGGRGVNGDPVPGVAALLAECERRLADPHGMGHGGACMTCDEIRRLLTPTGADGEEADHG